MECVGSHPHDGHEAVEQPLSLRDELAVLLVAEGELAEHAARHALALGDGQCPENACVRKYSEPALQLERGLGARL